MILFIWLGFIVIMILINWFVIVEKKSSPLHWLNSVIAAIVAFVLLKYGNEIRPLWLVIPCLFFSYWWIFDTGENILRKLKVWSLGTISVFDRLSQGLPVNLIGVVIKLPSLPLQVLWIFKGMLAIALIGIYYLDF